MIATLLDRKSSHNNNDQYIQWCTPNYTKIPFSDGDMCKLGFIDRLLDLEEYFNFRKICDEEKVRLASNKLDDEAEEWWEDIQIDRKRWGKHPIRSWQRMKRVLIDLWFPNDYYDILDYTVLIINLYIHMKINMFTTWKVKTKIITAKSMYQVKERVWELRKSSLFLKKILKCTSKHAGLRPRG